MTKQIGIITNLQTQVFQRDIITGVKDFVEAQGYTVLVDATQERSHNGRFTHLPLAELDGVVVIANILNNAQLQTLYETGKPITLVSHLAAQIPIPAVSQNNIEGIQQLVDYLIVDCERRNLVFVKGDMNQHDGIQRKRIFQQSTLRHNVIVPETHMLQGDFEPAIAAESVRKFIDAGYTCDAIVAADYLMGVAVLDVLSEANISVPDEVCVVGFGDGIEAEEAGLSTVGADVVEMGRRAARQLMVQIKGQRFTGVTWLNTELIPRFSCQPITQES